MLERNIIAATQHNLADTARADLISASDRLRQLFSSGPAPLDGESTRLVETLLSAMAEAEQQLAEQTRRIRQLENLSMTDELTGTLNRRGFQSALNRALAEAQRHGESGVLMICDLDHFKAINDAYGHMAGDCVLREVADVLMHHVRRNDYVARLGGDEFAVLMPRTPFQRAERLVKKLDGLLNTLVVHWSGHNIPVSASVGFEAFGRTTKAETLIFLADRALYRNKRPQAEFCA